MQERAASPPSQRSETTAPDARARRMIRMAGGLLLLVLTLWMLRFYLTALGWAVIIAISVWPLYRRIQAWLEGSRVAAPLITTVALGFLLITPLALALTEIGREGQVVMEWLARIQQTGIPVPAWFQPLPFLSQQLDAWWQTHLAQPQSAKQFLEGIGGSNLTEWSKTLGGALLSRMLQA